MDKNAKRRLRKAVRDAKRADARARIPLPVAALRGLFGWLDEQLIAQPCDHTLRLTHIWIAGRGHDASIVISWLRDNGGFCDCEVLANVEQHVDEALDDA